MRTTVPSRNRAPQGDDLAIYVCLEEAITIALREVAEAKQFLRSGPFREIRKFLRLLLGHGDHHRKPRELGLDRELRDQLLLHFCDDLEGVLGTQISEARTDSAKQLSAAMKDVRAIISGTEAGALAREAAVTRFSEASLAFVPAAEQSFREWCEGAGGTDLARLMLRAETHGSASLTAGDPH